MNGDDHRTALIKARGRWFRFGMVVGGAIVIGAVEIAEAIR